MGEGVGIASSCAELRLSCPSCVLCFHGDSDINRSRSCDACTQKCGRWPRDAVCKDADYLVVDNDRCDSTVHSASGKNKKPKKPDQKHIESETISKVASW